MTIKQTWSAGDLADAHRVIDDLERAREKQRPDPDDLPSSRSSPSATSSPPSPPSHPYP